MTRFEATYWIITRAATPTLAAAYHNRGDLILRTSLERAEQDLHEMFSREAAASWIVWPVSVTMTIPKGDGEDNDQT